VSFLFGVQLRFEYSKMQHASGMLLPPVQKLVATAILILTMRI